MRIFFLLACAFLVLAIASDLAAKSRAAAAAASVARAGESQNENAHQRDIQLGSSIQMVSYVLAALGVVCWVTSAVRKERCYHPLLTVLVLVFLLLQFIAV